MEGSIYVPLAEARWIPAGAACHTPGRQLPHARGEKEENYERKTGDRLRYLWR